MARKCEICGRGPKSGNRVSHSNKKSGRWFRPNLQKVRVIMDDGSVKTIKVCMRCLKSGKVRRYVKPPKEVEMEVS